MIFLTNHLAGTSRTKYNRSNMFPGQMA